MRFRALAPCAAVLPLAMLCACVSEPAAGEVVSLPAEAIRLERYINTPGGLISAQKITVQALTAYRKDTAPIVTGDHHTREITPDRIRLTNRTPDFLRDPVALSFRLLRLEAYEQLEVVFSDLPLLEHRDAGDQALGEPVLVLIVAEGTAHLRSGGVDLIGEKIVVRNDEARAYGRDGRPLGEAP